MAITAASLSAKAKRGWGWRFGKDGEPFANWEAMLVLEIETQGVVHNIRRLEENEDRKTRVDEIRKLIVDADDEKLLAAISALK